MFGFRVTKYDPAYRDSDGSYTRDEWISISDIGRSFAGVVLTAAEYQRVEDAYVTTAVAFLREAGVSSLMIVGLERSGTASHSLGEGTVLGLDEVGVVIRRVLREEFWCRLESSKGFVHIGYDYYMYLGVGQPCPDAEGLARQLGLFVEPFLSPYNEDESGRTTKLTCRGRQVRPSYSEKPYWRPRSGAADRSALLVSPSTDGAHTEAN